MAQRLTLQEKALGLKLAGHSYASISTALSHPEVVRQLGLPLGWKVAKVMAWRLVDLALKPTRQNVADSAAKYKAIQVRQCEEIIKALWDKRGTPRTADAINRQQIRLARLLGIDSPEKLEVTRKGGGAEGMTLEEAAAEITQAATALERAKRGGRLELVAGGRSTGTDGGAAAPAKDGGSKP